MKDSNNPDNELKGVLMQVYERLLANPKTWYSDALRLIYEKKIRRLFVVEIVGRRIGIKSHHDNDSCLHSI